MSRRPKGGMGARKKVGKQEPLVSEAWGTLATTAISMLETVGSINEDANDDCVEEAAQLTEMNKKRMSQDDKLELLNAITQVIDGFLGAFADLDEEGRQEHNEAELFENFYGSMFTLITESIEGINKAGVTPEAKEQLEQQLAMILRLIDTLMAVSFDNDQESALKYFKPFATTLFELCCTQLCLNEKYDFMVRSMALGLLTDQIESKTLNTFLLEPEQKSVLELIIDTCFKLCEKEDPKEKDAEEEDEEHPQQEANSQDLGTQLLDTLTSSLVTESGESVVAQMIFARSSGVLNAAASEPLITKAALVCLAVIPEAATVFAKKAEYLNTVVEFITKFSKAPHQNVVRSSAYIALAEHAEHLQPEFGQYHSRVLAGIIEVLKDGDDKSPYQVKSKACLPLRTIVSEIKTVPQEYIATGSDKNLMRLLLDLIKPLATKKNEDMTEEDYDLLNEYLIIVDDFASAYSAAFEAKTLGAAGEFLAPFVQEAYDALYALAQKSSEEVAWVVRGSAVAGAATIAGCMGKDALLAKMSSLASLLQACMSAGEEGEELPEEIFNVRRTMHVTYGQLATKLGAAFEPYLEAYVPFIERAFADGYGGSAQEEEEEDEDGMPVGAEPNQAADQERVIALGAYLYVVKALGTKFIPFQQRCFSSINEHYKTYSPDVQKGVCELIADLPAYLYPIDTKPSAGVDMVLPAALAELVKSGKSILLDYAGHATDTEVVETALESLMQFLKLYGQVVVNDDAATMVAFEKVAKGILRKRAPCQTVDPREIAYVDMDNGFGAGGFGGFGGEDEEGEEGEEDEEEEEEEEEEHEHGEECASGGCGGDSDEQDAYLMDSLTAVLGVLATAKGAAFKPTLDALWPRILKARSKKPYSAAINGFIGDMADLLADESFAEYRKQVFPLLLADLNNSASAPSVLRNTAYALGQVFLKCGPDSTKEYYESAVNGLNQGLTILQTTIDASDDKTSEEYNDLLGAKDNLISAIGRMLMVGAEFLPRATLVPTFIAGLPLKNDFSENSSVYAAVAKLVNTMPASHPGVLEPHYPALLKAFAQVAGDNAEDAAQDKLLAFIAKTARTILTSTPALKLDTIVTDATQRAALEKRIASADDSSSSQ